MVFVTSLCADWSGANARAVVKGMHCVAHGTDKRNREEASAVEKKVGQFQVETREKVSENADEPHLST